MNELLNSNIFTERCEAIIDIVIGYFKEFPVSTVFLLFLFFILILNIVKSLLIWWERKHIESEQKCEYLIKTDKGQECDIPFRRSRFHRKANSCNGCWGKSLKITNAEVEKRIMKGSYWKHMIIILSTGGKNLLPYISFLYTLAVAITENIK